MAIRAVISPTEPKPSDKLADFWLGGFEIDGDDGAGITVSGIISALPGIDAGTWYRLSDFSQVVHDTSWSDIEDQWTSLRIEENCVGDSSPVAVQIRMSDAVASICLSTERFLSSFENENIWIRFE